MPGFLEDESTFNRKYTKYLSVSIKKIGQKEKETEQFLMSIQSLRDRISPFILRRTKENVMKELPPKILQDYQCPLSQGQNYLHEILEKMFPYVEEMKSIDVKSENSKSNKSAIRNLLMHRKLCNHPNLILNDSKVMKQIHDEIGKDEFTDKYNDLIQDTPEIHEQSGKLRSLISLLEECGLLTITD